LLVQTVQLCSSSGTAAANVTLSSIRLDSNTGTRASLPCLVFTVCIHDRGTPHGCCDTCAFPLCMRPRVPVGLYSGGGLSVVLGAVSSSLLATGIVAVNNTVGGESRKSIPRSLYIPRSLFVSVSTPPVTAPFLPICRAGAGTQVTVRVSLSRLTNAPGILL
jgi:hypothetical protein